MEELADLKRTLEILYWDQATQMPSGGSKWRGRQLATLGRITHERSTDPELGRVLERLRRGAEDIDPSSIEANLIKVGWKDYERATKVPPEFMALFQEHQAVGFNQWQQAREANDFVVVQGCLEKTVELSRQYAEYYPGYDSIADPLIDFVDEGMTAAKIRAWFAELRSVLVPLVEKIADRPVPETDFLFRNYPQGEQLAFGEKLIRRLGYDFNRGRQDKSAHPFMVRFSQGDIRITTRVKDDDLTEALFSTIHEAGHALYEQGVSDSLAGTPLAQGTSAGVHESQSRLWENIVGRSKPFWAFFLPDLQNQFRDQLSGVSLDDFYAAINRVERSHIRTDADEVTYNLHVMIRFEIELALLEGRLKVADLEDRWNADYEAALGSAPLDANRGVLQDIHWYAGQVGGEFQGYTLGNIMSAQIYGAAVAHHPEIPAEIEAGRFDVLLGWLRENLHTYGRTKAALPLIESATGAPLSIEPYVGYLNEKYGSLYQLGV